MTAMSTAITRQIVLDTETTGMNQIGAHYEGHKIIEIGAVEVINRRLTGNNFHVYLKPDRLVDPEAFGVHGIADEFLLDKPTFADVADEFMDYIRGAELVIHNASFDIGFMDYEFGKLNRGIGKTETQAVQHLADKLGFVYRGIITVTSDSVDPERRAYELLFDK